MLVGESLGIDVASVVDGTREGSNDGMLEGESLGITVGAVVDVVGAKDGIPEGSCD